MNTRLKVYWNKIVLIILIIFTIYNKIKITLNFYYTKRKKKKKKRKKKKKKGKLNNLCKICS